ncbi:TPA: CBS domain-containing protein, partial [Enterococcus faecium]|nr:CBS domain-containing protein [Enterococcus faecium]
DSPFLPVVTEDRIFKGIITRKELLKAVNFMVHELERRNILSPKIEELKEQIDIVS